LAKIFLENISKIFDETVEAVKNLTLEVPDGSLVSLLGPSGCGKTTTMRIVAGLEQPTTGAVYFDGRDVTDLSPSERNIAMVFQFPVVYGTMSVYDNIAFPLVNEGVPKSEVRHKVEQVAEILDIMGYLDLKPGGLDAGVRQRVALARAMIRRPNVYLLDEPLTNVDPKTRVFLRSQLKRLQIELGQTMIYVTHDQSESLTLADKIGLMNKGELLQYDSPDIVYNNPATTFIGWFIGNPGMNFVDCTLKESEGKGILDAGEFTYDVTEYLETLRTETSGSELIIGIRPEHMKLSKERGENNWLQARCRLVEPLGNRLIFHLAVGAKRIRVKQPPTISIVEGDNLWVGFPKDKVKIFDKKTTKLIV